jgi:sulfotransferase family protein
MRSWNTENMAQWGQQMEVLLASIHEMIGKPILVVANKLHHVLHLLLESGSFDIKLIHLVRGGRAVANSYIRRYNAFTGGVRLWTVTGILAPWFRNKLGPDKWLSVKYESLATRPDESLKTICRFLGLDFEPAMLRFSCRPYSGIGGSPGTFHKAEERIFLDSRWHEELSWKHRLAFALMSGWLNRLNGYGVL